MKVINVKDFQDYTFAKFDDLGEINPEGIVREKDLLQEGDILFVRSNGNRELIGRSVFVAGLKERISHSAFTIRGRFVSNKAHPRFYAYVFRTPFIRQTFSSFGGGTNISNLNQQILNALQVPLPPIEEQLKIASILSAYDDLIENNTRRIKILEQMARMIYREWFVNFRFPGHEQVKLVDSPCGMIPEGWEVRDLLDLSEVTYGFAFKADKFSVENFGKPVVRIRDVLEGCSSTYSTEKPANKYLVKNGDVLVGMDGDFHMGFWVGGEAYLVQRVARFRSKSEISNYHLFLAMEKPIQDFDATITGTTVAHLGDKHIKTIQIAWPDAALLAKVTQIFDPLLKHILTLRLKNRNLCQTRDLLLPKLISGEI